MAGDADLCLDLLLGIGGGDSLGERNFIVVSLWEIDTGGECEDDLLCDECFLEATGEFFLVILGDFERWFVLAVMLGDLKSTLFKTGGNGGGDSLGDRIFIAASSLVNGKAGEGDLLDTGDWIAGKWDIGDFDLDFSCTRPIVFCTILGGSFGKAISNTLSSFFSTLIFTGLITFLPRVSLAFAANPLCNRFNVCISFIFSSSSAFGSSSAISVSSSLEERNLTLGVIVRIFLAFEVDRDFRLLSWFFFWSRFFFSSNMCLYRSGFFRTGE